MASTCPNCGYVFNRQIVAPAKKSSKAGIVLTVIMLLLIAAGVGGWMFYSKFSKVSIVEDSAIYLGSGETYDLNFSGEKLRWTSSDDSIVQVSNGKLTGIGEGKATITAKTLFGQTSTVDVVSSNILDSWKLTGLYIGTEQYDDFDTSSASLTISENKITISLAGDTYQGTWEYKGIEDKTVSDWYWYVVNCEEDFDFDIYILNDDLVLMWTVDDIKLSFTFKRQ